MKLSDFDYNLPEERIAQKPVSPRDSSRLMVVSDSIEHRKFTDVVDYLNKGDVLVLNETKVIHAKLVGKKETGGKVELIISKYDGKICQCRIKTKNPKLGNKLEWDSE